MAAPATCPPSGPSSASAPTPTHSHWAPVRSKTAGAGPQSLQGKRLFWALKTCFSFNGAWEKPSCSSSPLSSQTCSLTPSSAGCCRASTSPRAAAPARQCPKPPACRAPEHPPSTQGRSGEWPGSGKDICGKNNSSPLGWGRKTGWEKPRGTVGATAALQASAAHPPPSKVPSLGKQELRLLP